MISLNAVGRSHGSRVLFRDVSLRLSPGRRVALVGPNGAGKTTLLDIVAGEQQPDTGEVARGKNIRIGYLHQEIGESAGRSVIAEVMAGAGEVALVAQRMEELQRCLDSDDGDDVLLAEYGEAQHRFEDLGGYGLESDARRVLAGLGFAAEDIDRDVGLLSGGWMMRVALARLLLSRPDVLLLDEPTNHLDLASVTWLEQFLAAYEGAIILVSHDRDFINAIATHVVELANGTATEYVGDYAAFIEQRQQRLEQLRAAAANQRRKVAHTEQFIERFRYKATKARQVQSRIKALNKLDRVEVPEDRQKVMRFRFPQPPRAGRIVMTLRGIVKRYGSKTVYDGLDLVLERGQKVALVGPNGAGKSTLLKILAGVLGFDAGERLPGHNVTVAYFAQHQIDALNLDNTVLQELAGAVDTSKVNPRSMLGTFRFSGDEVDKKVEVLSGGERSRLALAKMLADPANLLCMDEPTNHLDIASRDVLEDALVEYPGTVVLITHDRHLIRSVANTIIDVSGGTATLYPGDFEYFAAKTGVDLDGRGAAAADTAVVPAVQSDDGRAEARTSAGQKRAQAERRNRLHQQTKGLRARLRVVERDLGKAEAEVAELTRALADPAAYGDPEAVKTLVARHVEAKDRAAALFEEWAELETRIEKVVASMGAG
ncbi:MAG: ATP-binding cassette domain-containing protein [Nitriliruptorales bacterium]|nr:ATP-binding cassette domain-containing protein [Nitriliruptorales bacterium]